MTDTTQPPAETCDRLTPDEQMQDAQKGCAPCALCGGHAIINDAGNGAGYFIRCSNSQIFKASEGCLIEQRRLGGWAYNVIDWWNRLHTAALTRRAGGDAIPAGMKPWHGGDAAPADWDGGPVLRRHGGLSMPTGDFAWVSNGGGLGNVVAYSPKPTGWQPIATAPRDGSWFFTKVEGADDYPYDVAQFDPEFDDFTKAGCGFSYVTHWRPAEDTGGQTDA